MKLRKTVLCIILVFTVVGSITFVGAVQPPLPPAIEVIVFEGGFYTPGFEVVIDQITTSAALCGFSVTWLPLDWVTYITRVFAGDFDAFFVVNLAGSFPDTLEIALSRVEFFTGAFNVLGYDNPVMNDLVAEAYTLYYGGFLDEAIVVFHEIEALLHSEMPALALTYALYDDQVSQQNFYFNCREGRPFEDVILRRAFAHIIDTEFYHSTVNEIVYEGYFYTTHIMGMAPFHDASLPEYQYSIGKAVSILAKGGYRPAAVV